MTVIQHNTISLVLLSLASLIFHRQGGGGALVAARLYQQTTIITANTMMDKEGGEEEAGRQLQPMLLSSSSITDNILSTTFDGDRFRKAISFDITAINTDYDITLLEWGFNFADLDNKEFNVDIYYREGTADETTLSLSETKGNWILHYASSTSVYSSGTGNVTNLPNINSLTIPAGKTYGFILAASQFVVASTINSYPMKSNDDLLISPGCTFTEPFNGCGSVGRRVNTQLVYELSELPSSSPTMESSLSPTSAPSLSVRPSTSPTLVPSESPTMEPSLLPSTSPTLVPSSSPSMEPSLSPTSAPSLSIRPSTSPTLAPSESPSYFHIQNLTTPFDATQFRKGLSFNLTNLSNENITITEWSFNIESQVVTEASVGSPVEFELYYNTEILTTMEDALDTEEGWVSLGQQHYDGTGSSDVVVTTNEPTYMTEFEPLTIPPGQSYGIVLYSGNFAVGSTKDSITTYTSPMNANSPILQLSSGCHFSCSSEWSNWYPGFFECFANGSYRCDGRRPGVVLDYTIDY